MEPKDPRSIEQRRRDERVVSGTASIDDHLAFALDELCRADQALPPYTMAMDGYHASACVERARCSVRIARDTLAAPVKP